VGCRDGGHEICCWCDEVIVGVIKECYVVVVIRDDTQQLKLRSLVGRMEKVKLSLAEVSSTILQLQRSCHQVIYPPSVHPPYTATRSRRSLDHRTNPINHQQTNFHCSFSKRAFLNNSSTFSLAPFPAFAYLQLTRRAKPLGMENQLTRLISAA
jgi:hypothetical protein